ncbi:MAG: ABC transporter ATP-binding protein [Candidatus Eisenbacteria bacterium]|nr:ABC transporter ATP-binding protein [Candidatus Eisenbacteria bacterium]
MPDALLDVKNLKTYFHTDLGVVKAVDEVSFSVRKGASLGVVGESGCGKSVTALSILRLIPSPPGKIESGEVIFKDKDLLKLSESEMRKIRGNEISMVFQEPMTSLNPVFTCGYQIQEAVVLHQKLGKKEARAKTIEMLNLVGIPAPAQRVDEYPHQLSGGMRQRVMIAMALSCNPALLIADEPTTALDVTVQAQILDLIGRLRGELGMSLIIITHDLGVIAEVADEVAIMYASKVVEFTDVKTIFETPLHPYTDGLLESIPPLDGTKDRLSVIPGVVPNPVSFPTGCKFHPRCKYAFGKCASEEPELKLVTKGHWVRCWLRE